MKCLFRVYMILLIKFVAVSFLLSQHAYAYGHKIGGWDLIKIIPMSNQVHDRPILEKGLRLELISERFTIWSGDVEKGKRPDPNIYCHPERINGYKFNDVANRDEQLKKFINQVGGINKLKRILNKNFRFHIKNLGSVYSTGENKDGKEPCKSIQNMNFYLSKDMKSVFMFEYPYIYYFKGDFGYIDGTEKLK